jgi:hypothetical protein
MELDQIFTDSFGYAKSSWTKVAMLGAIILITFILVALGAIVAGWIGNLIVGIVIGIVLVLICIAAALLYYGYVYRVIKATLAGIDELPNFDDFVGMIVDGLKVLVVSIIYGIIAGIILAIIWGIVLGIMFVTGLIAGGAASAATGLSSISDPTAIIGVMAGMFAVYGIIFILYFIAMLATIIVAYLFLILVPMGIANMAQQGSLGAAFSFSDIKERLNKIRWVKALLWVVGLNFIVSIIFLISYVLCFILIGLILVPLLIVPFVSIFTFRSTALLYLEGE